MAPPQKRAFDRQDGSSQQAKKPRTAAAPTPAFTSSLQHEEVDFPRGGGTSLTALEMKETMLEGRKMADMEAEQEAETAKNQKPKKVGKREVARKKKENDLEKQKEWDKDKIRVEQLNYKRLQAGTRLLTRVHQILPLHLLLSLPNNLYAHVPITSISTTLTTQLAAEESSDVASNASDSEVPDLADLFVPGQYLVAQVEKLFPTASNELMQQYQYSETLRLAGRVECTLVPEVVNADVSKADLEVKEWKKGTEVQYGFKIQAEVLGEEDRGWRVGLGVEGLEGFVANEEVAKFVQDKRLIPGQILACTITSVGSNGRVAQLSLDPLNLKRSIISEVSTVGSIIPGSVVSALITNVLPNGLNVRVCGFFDGTVELAHLAIGDQDVEDAFKVGKRIRARIIWDNVSTSPRQFALSLTPHILDLDEPMTPNGETRLTEFAPVGKTVEVTVIRVIQEWGLVVRTSDGIDGFVHISHISDERLPALSASTGRYKTGTSHQARVMGLSPLDGILLLSLEKKVLDQVFMQVDELKVGQILKGTVKRLSEKALFIDIKGAVDGVVWPAHYADIKLKQPEKRFKVGSNVKARVYSIEPARNRVVLTLKKTLVDSPHPVTESFDQVTLGMITPGVVAKVLDKGCLVSLFGGLRAFVPMSEASNAYVQNLDDVFYEGKPVNVKIIEVDEDAEKLVASVKQALPSAVAAADIEVGNRAEGVVVQIHSEQVVLALVPSQSTALISLSNLANHRHEDVAQVKKSLKIGEKITDLVVVSKDPKTNLLIVANNPTGRTPSGVSQIAVTADSLQAGQILPGRVIGHSAALGTLVQLSNQVRGRIHPTDTVDDLKNAVAPEVQFSTGDIVKCCIVRVDAGSRNVDLSTRPSRLHPSAKAKIVDPELEGLSSLKPGMPIRGLVKRIAPKAGLFVSLSRDITARVTIREMFDDYVKEWQPRFTEGQVVAGKILSVDETDGLVEMTLRKNPSKSQTAKSTTSLSDYTKGQKVVAVVKRVETYGIFLRIDGSQVSGLCHKSEISDDKKQDVAQALKGFREGDQVKAIITSVDAEKGKIAFGIKASYFAEDDFEQPDVAMASDEESDEEMADGDQDEEDEDEDEDEDDDEDDEDDDMDDDEDDEDDVDDVIEVAAAKPKTKSKKAAASTAPVSALQVGTGFDWNATGQDSGDDSESDDEEDAPVASSSKAAGKKRAFEDLTATAASGQPESTAEFERALLASPNSSFLWIQFMSFQLQLHEVEKARKIGRRALESIQFREEEEKLNVWMALVNLEIGFGTEQSIDKVFKEAVQYNDAKTVYFRFADSLQANGKNELAEEIFKKAVKKFSQYPEAWTRAAEFYLKRGEVDAARELLPRSLKSLEKAKHVETIEKMAVLEFKSGDAERGKTIFEGIVDSYPKRLDVWGVYIDQVAKENDVQGVRNLVDRALDQKLTSKKAKFLFKKLLAIETRIGDEDGQNRAKEKARDWVLAQAGQGDDE